MVDKLELGEIYTTTYFALNPNNKYIFIDFEDLDVAYKYTFYNIDKNKKHSVIVMQEKSFLEDFFKI